MTFWYRCQKPGTQSHEQDSQKLRYDEIEHDRAPEDVVSTRKKVSSSAIDIQSADQG